MHSKLICFHTGPFPFSELHKLTICMVYALPRHLECCWFLLYFIHIVSGGTTSTVLVAQNVAFILFRNSNFFRVTFYSRRSRLDCNKIFDLIASH